MLKTVYIHTKNNVVKALRKRKRLLTRGFVVMWTGEHLICMMRDK